MTRDSAGSESDPRARRQAAAPARGPGHSQCRRAGGGWPGRPAGLGPPSHGTVTVTAQPGSVTVTVTDGAQASDS